MIAHVSPALCRNTQLLVQVGHLYVSRRFVTLQLEPLRLTQIRRISCIVSICGRQSKQDRATRHSMTLILTHVARRRTGEEVLDTVRFCPNHYTALERVEGLRLDIPFGLVRLRNRRSFPTRDVHSWHML